MATGGVITYTGQNMMLHRTFTTNATQSRPIRFYLGVGTTTPNKTTDTGMEFKIPMNSTTFDNCNTTTGWNNSGTVSGALVVNQTAGQFREGTGCLNMVNTASGMAVYYKKQTGVDFKDKVYLYYYNASPAQYLSNVSNAVTVFLGNNSTATNSNEYHHARSSMSDGWNILKFDTVSTNAINGTGCDTTDVSYVALRSNCSSACTGTLQRMDYWIFSTSENMSGAFVTGYPLQDTSNRRMTTRGYVTSVQANNFSITEYGIFNSDTSEVMWSHDVSSAVSKVPADEMAVIWVDNMT